jgi:hypothetical protein
MVAEKMRKLFESKDGIDPDQDRESSASDLIDLQRLLGHPDLHREGVLELLQQSSPSTAQEIYAYSLDLFNSRNI